MKQNEINNLLENISDINIKYFIDIINKKYLSIDIIDSVLGDLYKLLAFTKDFQDKKRITNYINKINNLKNQEKLEREKELKELNLEIDY